MKGVEDMQLTIVIEGLEIGLAVWDYEGISWWNVYKTTLSYNELRATLHKVIKENRVDAVWVSALKIVCLLGLDEVFRFGPEEELRAGVDYKVFDINTLSLVTRSMYLEEEGATVREKLIGLSNYCSKELRKVGYKA